MTTTQTTPAPVRYALATGRGRVEIRDGLLPSVPDGHVRVAVGQVGICQSDVADLNRGTGPFPARFGHEVSGRVLESADPDLPEGTRVAVLLDDGCATHVDPPRSMVVRLDDGCNDTDAALSEPLACVLGAVQLLPEYDEVVVVGAGFMGLLALRLLVTRGHRVVAVDPAPEARSQASAWGAAETMAPIDLGPSDHASAGLVVEATGRPDGLTLAGDLTGAAGTLGILGYHQSDEGRRTVDMRGWNYRALRVLNLHHRDRTDVVRWMGQAQRLSALGVVRPGELVRARVGLADLPAVFLGDGPKVKTMVQVSAEATADGSAS